MAKEILAVPEEYLEEVIRVIRAGLVIASACDVVREQLTKWCDSEEEYLRTIGSGD